MKLVFTASHGWFRNFKKKRSPRELVFLWQAGEERKPNRVNSCAKEILAHIWFKIEEVTQIRFKVSAAK